jgi:hypothetical protein
MVVVAVAHNCGTAAATVATTATAAAAGMGSCGCQMRLRGLSWGSMKLCFYSATSKLWHMPLQL